MKKQPTRKSSQKNPSSPRLACLLLIATALMPGFVSTEVCGQINGTITGGSVTGNFGDDTITASTINIGYFTSCHFITQGVTNQGFGGYNFVFAGQGAASGIANINPSDFTVSQYAPWIG